LTQNQPELEQKSNKTQSSCYKHANKKLNAIHIFSF
jgi:hypothetical protein